MTAAKEILIVCYGNICRSPMAAAVLQRELAARGMEAEYSVTSAGVGAVEGLPAAALSQRVASDSGLSLESHRARQLTPEMAAAAWKVIAMDEYVEDGILRIAGDVAVEAWQVDDPYGGPEEGYRRAFTAIQARVAAFVASLAQV